MTLELCGRWPCPLWYLPVLGVQEPFPDPVPEEIVESWPLLVQAGWFLVTFLAVLLVSRLLLQPAVDRVVRQRNRNNPTLHNAVLLYFRLLSLLVAIAFGAVVAGYGRFLGGSALLISAIALAIGVAAQEVIGSLVSGIALVLDPEFNVGDHIEWSDGEGVVQAVALRITRVETHGGELITVPNTIFTSQEITRPYGRGNLRIVQTFRLGYDTDLEEAMALLEEAATSIDAILAVPPPKVYVGEFEDVAVAVHVHYWIKGPTRRDVSTTRSRYARSVKTQLDDAGIDFSTPSEHVLRGRLEIDREE